MKGPKQRVGTITDPSRGLYELDPWEDEYLAQVDTLPLESETRAEIGPGDKDVDEGDGKKENGKVGDQEMEMLKI